MKKPTVPDVLPLVRRLYRCDDPCSRDAGRTGGHLHIVLDDGNIETNHVEFCLARAREDNCSTCIKIAELMLQMSQTQRAKLSHGAYGDGEP